MNEKKQKINHEVNKNLNKLIIEFINQLAIFVDFGSKKR